MRAFLDMYPEYIKLACGDKKEHLDPGIDQLTAARGKKDPYDTPVNLIVDLPPGENGQYQKKKARSITIEQFRLIDIFSMYSMMEKLTDPDPDIPFHFHPPKLTSKLGIKKARKKKEKDEGDDGKDEDDATGDKQKAKTKEGKKKKVDSSESEEDDEDNEETEPVVINLYACEEDGLIDHYEKMLKSKKRKNQDLENDFQELLNMFKNGQAIFVPQNEGDEFLNTTPGKFFTIKKEYEEPSEKKTKKQKKTKGTTK